MATCKDCFHYDVCGINVMEDDVICRHFLNKTDAAPVVHGRWVPTNYDKHNDAYKFWDKFVCSVCGDGIDNEHYLPKYCESCGAKMDLEV